MRSIPKEGEASLSWGFFGLRVIGKCSKSLKSSRRKITVCWEKGNYYLFLNSLDISGCSWVFAWCLDVVLFWVLPSSFSFLQSFFCFRICKPCVGYTLSMRTEQAVYFGDANRIFVVLFATHANLFSVAKCMLNRSFQQKSLH